MCADVEAEGHCRVYFGEMNLLGGLFVTVQVLSLDLGQVIWHRVHRVMRVQKDQELALDPDEVVSFLWTASDDSNVKFAFEKMFDSCEVLLLDFLKAKAY